MGAANQDAVMARGGIGSPTGDLVVLAVADGVGGEQGGSVASHVAVSTLDDLMADRIADGADDSPGDLVDLLMPVIAASRNRLRERREADPTLSRMATTFTAVAISDFKVGFVHLGDSRAYLVRRGELRRLTTDHTVAQELVVAGALTAENAAFHRGGQILTRWLAPDKEFPPERGLLAAQPDDLVLVCSDGLYRMVDEETIRSLCQSFGPETGSNLDALATVLMARANENGGEDDISVALAVLVER